MAMNDQAGRDDAHPAAGRAASSSSEPRPGAAAEEVSCEPCCEPETCAPRTIDLSAGEAAELADLAKALGHPTRVAILKALLAGGRCHFGSLAAELDYAQSTVSQHFKILREAGLVAGEVEGVSVCYCAVPEALERLRELLARF